jgi:hypothetical protein
MMNTSTPRTPLKLVVNNRRLAKSCHGLLAFNLTSMTALDPNLMKELLKFLQTTVTTHYSKTEEIVKFVWPWSAPPIFNLNKKDDNYNVILCTHFCNLASVVNCFCKCGREWLMSLR